MNHNLGEIVGNIAGKPIRANQLNRQGSLWGHGSMTLSDGKDTMTTGIAKRVTANAKSIIIYWSRSGSTELLAGKIDEITNSDVCQITLAEPYPADYIETRTRANLERSTGAIPLLNMDLPNLEQYDIIYFGFQTWAMTLSEPIKAFLKIYGKQFSNKTIKPFETQGGYGSGDCLQVMDKLLKQTNATNYKIMPALIVDGNKVHMANEVVKKWALKSVT